MVTGTANDHFWSNTNFRLPKIKPYEKKIYFFPIDPNTPKPKQFGWGKNIRGSMMPEVAPITVNS